MAAMPAMVSRMPRLEAASIAQSTIAPAGWFTARRMSRSAGGTTAPNLSRRRGCARIRRNRSLCRCRGPCLGTWNGAMRDRKLVDLCTRGDRRAWAELFRKQDRRLRRILARAGRGDGGLDAADLRQEGWLRLIEKRALGRPRLERDGALDAFFAQVARRVALDHQRQHEPAPLAALPAPRPPDPEAEALRAEERRELNAALSRVVGGSGRD